jgi:hypothetical protein
MFVPFLFLQILVTTRAFNCYILSFIVLSDNQNPTSALRNFNSDVCNICLLVNCALRAPQPLFQVLHLSRHIRKFTVIKPNACFNSYPTDVENMVSS